jgi:hypothetical protein
LRVHRRQALIEVDEGFLCAAHRRDLDLAGIAAQEGAGFPDLTMRVNVDGLHTLAVDADRQLLAHGLLSVGIPQETATAEHDAGGSPALQKVSTGGHQSSSSFIF